MKSQGFFSAEPSFELMTGYLKAFFKFVKEDENMGLKNKCLIGGRILMTSKIYRREDLKTGYIACVNIKVISRIFLS